MAAQPKLHAVQVLLDPKRHNGCESVLVKVLALSFAEAEATVRKTFGFTDESSRVVSMQLIRPGVNILPG